MLRTLNPARDITIAPPGCRWTDVALSERAQSVLAELAGIGEPTSDEHAKFVQQICCLIYWYRAYKGAARPVHTKRRAPVFKQLRLPRTACSTPWTSTGTAIVI